MNLKSVHSKGTFKLLTWPFYIAMYMMALLISVTQLKAAQIDSVQRNYYLKGLATDTFRLYCYTRYIEQGKFDSLLLYTQTQYAENKISRWQAYTNYTLCYYNLKQMDDCRLYMDQAIGFENDLTRQYNDDISIFFTQDCVYFNPMCFDEQLIDRYKKQDIDYYESRNYPDSKIGNEILLLGFKDQFNRKKMDLNKVFGVDSKKLWAEDKDVNARFVEILRKYGYLTKSEIGRLLISERVLIWHVPMKMGRQEIVIPALEAAHKKGKLETEVLISNLVRTKVMNGDVEMLSKEFYALIDELCRTYNFDRKAYYYGF